MPIAVGCAACTHSCALNKDNVHSGPISRLQSTLCPYFILCRPFLTRASILLLLCLLFGDTEAGPKLGAFGERLQVVPVQGVFIPALGLFFFPDKIFYGCVELENLEIYETHYLGSWIHNLLDFIAFFVSF